jgi:hypothetical protein
VTGERDLRALLAGMQPDLLPEIYVFTNVPGQVPPPGLRPFATVAEDEGTTLVLRQQDADNAGLTYDYLAARIALRVHSDLAAVGLTAAVSTQLAGAGISCNVIAGYVHDHLFVPRDRAAEALRVLQQLTKQAGAH